MRRHADLLKNKSRPETAAEGAPEWVVAERELREKLKKEREAKERELEKEVCLVNCISQLSVC
jgi:chaperone BCS1